MLGAWESVMKSVLFAALALCRTRPGQLPFSPIGPTILARYIFRHRLSAVMATVCPMTAPRSRRPSTRQAQGHSGGVVFVPSGALPAEPHHLCLAGRARHRLWRHKAGLCAGRTTRPATRGHRPDGAVFPWAARYHCARGSRAVSAARQRAAHMSPFPMPVPAPFIRR